MSIRLITIRALQPEPAQTELNTLLATERVVTIQREFVGDGSNSFWAFCVEVADGPGPLPDVLKTGPGRGVLSGRAAPAIDYKQVLSEADFAVFAGLRDWRKQAAQAEGVPVYAVFTNEQLAEIARRGIGTLADLADIDGIGAAKRALAPGVFACRRGGGVHRAVQAVQSGLQRWPWVVQVDVDGFFPSIDHGVLLAQLRRLFKGEAFLALLARIVMPGVGPRMGVAACAIGDNEGRGLPIGSLTSQHFANHYLGVADRLLASLPGVHAPVRYMDDIVWFCESADVARSSLAQLRGLLIDALHLRLKDKVIVRSCSQGLVFCGYRIKPGVILPGRRKRRRFGQSVQRLKVAGAAGLAPMADLQRAHDVLQSGLLPAESRGLRRRLWWPAAGEGRL